jgi:FlaG/FlaF family flagellin (archaellin)
MIHDFHRDWRRWSSAERALAPVIAAILLIAIPAAILLTI